MIAVVFMAEVFDFLSGRPSPKLVIFPSSNPPLFPKAPPPNGLFTHNYSKQLWVNMSLTVLAILQALAIPFEN
jgi:hypothetical protein